MKIIYLSNYKVNTHIKFIRNLYLYLLCLLNGVFKLNGFNNIQFECFVYKQSNIVKNFLKKPKI